jgi:hypothetical protein
VAGYDDLLADIMSAIEDALRAVARSVNAVMTATCWLVGQRIVEREQEGAARARYGEALLERLSADLTRRFGRGFSVCNLRQMRAMAKRDAAERRAALELIDAEERAQHEIEAAALDAVADAPCSIARDWTPPDDRDVPPPSDEHAPPADDVPHSADREPSAASSERIRLDEPPRFRAASVDALRLPADLAGDVLPAARRARRTRRRTGRRS